MPQDSDSRPEKILITVRMDPALHRQLCDYVYELGHNLPPKERPCADAVIQQAIRQLLAEHVPSQPVQLQTEEERPAIPPAFLPLVRELVELLQEPDQSRHRHWRDAVRDLLQARIGERRK